MTSTVVINTLPGSISIHAGYCFVFLPNNSQLARVSLKRPIKFGCAGPRDAEGRHLETEKIPWAVDATTAGQVEVSRLCYAALTQGRTCKMLMFRTRDDLLCMRTSCPFGSRRNNSHLGVPTVTLRSRQRPRITPLHQGYMSFQ